MTDPVLLTIASHPDRENEDAVVTGPGKAVVVDGAGIPPQWRAGCHHSVAWYSHTLAAELFTRLADPATPMTDCLAAAITAVRSRHENSCNLDQGSPSATVAAWRETTDTIQYLVLCDASIILRYTDGAVEEITDTRLEQVIAPLIQQHLKGASTEIDPVEPLLLARQQAVEATRNRPNGFWCCQIDPAAAGQAIYGELPLDEVSGVIAASDGATRGYQLLNLHSVTEFADQILERTPIPVAEAIRSAETDQAAAQAARGNKVHDDLTIASASFH